MALSFRHRILIVLIALGAVPTALVLAGWTLTLRRANPGVAGRAAIEEVAASGRVLLETVDSTRLSPAGRRALAAHAGELNDALNRIRAADSYSRYYAAGLTLAILLPGLVLLYASVRLGGHLSRQLSRPIEELIGWTGHIRRHEPLPAGPPRKGAPEFAALRTALREMADGLDRGRSRELEAERLRAFGEVARRVAHEMKNPLTPIRFAVAQLESSATGDQAEALGVLRAEAGRLETLAREFAELGRLPEGPPAEVDLAELLGELARTSLPPGVTARLYCDPAAPLVLGHFESLRRAFGNVVRNAVEAMDGQGVLDVRVARHGAGVRVIVADHGPGIDPAAEARLFEPYNTTKADGTGLGLAIVRQVIEAHRGEVAVEATPGGGATFVFDFPGPQ